MKLVIWLPMIVFVFGCTPTYAQKVFAIDTVDKAYIEKLSKHYKAQNEILLERLRDIAPNKKLYKYYYGNYEYVFAELNQEIEDGLMTYNQPIFALFDKILKEIRAKNPQVPDNLQLFLVRNNASNAYTLGDNTIFMNLGLFRYMENEDQIASVMTHEIAHLLLNHTIKALNYGYEQDQKSAADAKHLQRTSTRVSDRAMELFKSSIYKSYEVRRSHEMEADSLGYVLLKKTKYDAKEIIPSLNLLEQYNESKYKDVRVGTYKQFFDLPVQKFKEEWLEGEDFSSYNYNDFTKKFDEDSLLTHPETEDRIKYLKSTFPELANIDSTGRGLEEVYKQYRELAKKEGMANLYFNKYYGISIYWALVFLQDDPDNEYYRKWLGTNFYRIYEARRDYQLNKYLDRVSPKDQSESYVRFLNFMWNLSLDEMKNIADYYVTKYP